VFSSRNNFSPPDGEIPYVMPHFKVHTIESAPAASREALDAAGRRYGMIPNLLAVLAESPEALKAYLTLSDLFSSSSLTPVEQQVVLLAGSFENRCEYCMAAHSMLARHAGAGDDVVTALREGKAIPEPHLDALARLTRSIVRERGWVAESEVARFIDAGYTPAQLLEVLVGVAQKTLSNYTNHLASTPLDKAFASHAWARTERSGSEAA
jgi:AhpD family alkylhydroperoxidase